MIRVEADATGRGDRHEHVDAQALVARYAAAKSRQEAGIEGFQRVLAVVPDFRVDLVRWSASGEVVFIEMALHGTIGGRVLEVGAVDRFTVRDGKAVERVSYFDPSPFTQALAAAVQ